MFYDLLLLLIALLLSALIYRWYRIFHNPSASVSLANNFNFQEYTGKWYIIAHLPNQLEENLENLTVKHEMMNNEYIKLTIEGNRPKNKNKKVTMKGKMWPKYQNTRPSLNVQFLWPFIYNCRIIYIKGNYDIVIFTTYTKDRLWIMSRSPEIPEDEYQQLLSSCRKRTFDLADLEKIHHDKN